MDEVRRDWRRTSQKGTSWSVVIARYQRDQVPEGETGETCDKNGGEEKYVQGFYGEIWRKRTLGKRNVRWQDNIKIISK